MPRESRKPRTAAHCEERVQSLLGKTGANVLSRVAALILAAFVKLSSVLSPVGPQDVALR